MQFMLSENVWLAHACVGVRWVWVCGHSTVWSEFQFIYLIREHTTHNMCTYDSESIFPNVYPICMDTVYGLWHTIWMRAMWVKVGRVMLHATPKCINFMLLCLFSMVECKQSESRDVDDIECSHSHLVTANSPKTVCT